MCPKSKKYRLIFATNKDHPYKSVAFLDSSDEMAGALLIFNELSQKGKNYFNVGFDYWRDGVKNDHRHHGWKKSDYGGKYTSCHVFKGRKDNNQLRLYGFKCHPKVGDRYELCVLVNFAYKNRHETHEIDLKKVIQAEINSEIQLTIRETYLENKK